MQETMPGIRQILGWEYKTIVGLTVEDIEKAERILLS